MLTFNDDIGTPLKKACDHNSDQDAMYLVHAAKVVHREMFESSFTFNGSFSECNSLPQSLLTLVNMILEGPKIKHHSTNNMKAATAISHLLFFNSMKYARDADAATTVLHAHQWETPLPLYMYIAMKIHAVTRKRSLIDALFIGVCVFLMTGS